MCTAVEFCEYSEKTGVGKVTANKFTRGGGSGSPPASYKLGGAGLHGRNTRNVDKMKRFVLQSATQCCSTHCNTGSYIISHFELQYVHWAAI